MTLDPAWLAAQTDSLLTGARLAADPAGGFRWLDATGSPDLRQGRPLWITARMTHVFALGALLHRPGDAEFADHGVAALTGPFADTASGGWFPGLDDDGSPTSTAKTAYEHAFVLLAASTATLAGRPGAAELLASAVAVQEQRFWDDDAGAVVEEWDRDWDRLDGYRGANANMHSVEAYLAAADATGDAVWRDRALRIAARLIDGEARRHGWRLPEHYDAAWSPMPDYNRDRPDDRFRPYGITPGHGLEWARLLVHLAAALPGPPEWLLPAAEALFRQAVADGWDVEHEGFYYTCAPDGRPVVRSRFHWVVCEAIGAAATLDAVVGDARYATAQGQFWDHARRYFIDPAGGFGWLHELDALNRPVPDGVWPGRPDWYHSVQATLLPVLPITGSLAESILTRPA